MFAYQRANRILAYWLSGDCTSMTREMKRAIRDQFHRPATRLDDEERELLASISGELIAAVTKAHPAASDRVASCFALLQHLSTRSQQTSNAADRAA